MAIRKLFMVGSIDLTRLSDKIQRVEDLTPDIRPYAATGKNGHVYLGIVIDNKKEETSWGHTHNFKVGKVGVKSMELCGLKDCTKEDSYSGNNTNYEKPKYQEPAPVPNPKPKPESKPTRQYNKRNDDVVNTDDLPF